MAVQISAAQPGPVMCGTESVAYGTQPATFVPNTQGVHAMNSPNAIEADEQFQEIVTHQQNFEQSKDIPTFTTKDVNLSFPIYGGSAANSPPLWAPFFQCAGAKGTVVAGTPGAYTFTQATRLQVATMAATIAQEMYGDTTGWVEEVNGVYGNCVVTAAPDAGIIATLTGKGLMQAPQSGTLKSIYGSGSTNWSAGTCNANKSIVGSTNKLKINNGGSDYIPVCGGFRFDMGVTYGPVTDMNGGDNYGVFGIRITRMQPTLTLTIALDGDTSANVDYSDLYADAAAGTTHAITYIYTDLASRTLTFSFPTAQPKTKRKNVRENVRSLELQYKLQGTVPFLITQG